MIQFLNGDIRMTRLKVQTEQQEATGMIAEAVTTVSALIFAVFSAIKFAVEGSVSDILLSLATAFLVMLPVLIEKLFRCRFAPVVWIWVTLYAVAPLLGESYNLYFIISWWDKLLHFSGGIAFALIGYYLIKLLNKGKPVSLAVRIVFAICFSIALSAVWEFYEFGMDRVFGTDMQQDRYITAVNSYFLADGYGVVGSLENIDSVVVNGQKLSGYIDIGLIDTMGDMLIETLGAVIAALFFAVDRERHPIISPAYVIQTQPDAETAVCHAE